jgi:glycosyltransferase involved in cell wall biosynthesis
MTKTFLDEARIEFENGEVKKADIGDIDAPRISVIIPAYNRQGMVIETIAALGRQTFPSFEVIVVDNCSADSTFTVAAEAMRASHLSGKVLRRMKPAGPAKARNAGLLQARGDFIAFTDSDCLPSPGWLEAGLAAMDAGADIVQGETREPPGAKVPFFSHFIVTDHLDGSFSTSNVFYRREHIVAAGGFNPACDYWEDIDLGWRVIGAGASAVFYPNALVYHQAVPQTPLAWALWPSRLIVWTAATARYPNLRRHLFLRYWRDPPQAALMLALAGIAGATRFRPSLLLVAPYIIAFRRRHKLSGRWPVLKAALHLWWDVFSMMCLIVGSARHRTVVL